MSIKIEINLMKSLKDLYNHLSDIMAKFTIGHLLLLSFALHLFSISFPSDGGLIFDEAYYVPAAEKTLLLQPANVEHTPLAKIMVALSIKIFGDYWFAWRFPIVLTAIGSLYVFYLIAKRFMSERYALFATAMLSFDVIFFIHGSIFVLDMPTICFGLIGVYLYLIKKYKWSAFALGISFLMEILGLLFIGGILIYHVVTHLKLREFKSKLNFKKISMFLVVLLLIGGGGLWMYDAIYKPASGAVAYVSIMKNVVVDQSGTPITTITSIQNVTKVTLMTNPIDNMKFYWDYFFGMGQVLNFSASELRPPWTWVLPIGNSLNPPHYFTVTVTANGISYATIDWRSQITPFIEYFLLPIAIIALFNIVRKKDQNKLGLFLLSMIIATYIPFLMLGIINYPHETNFNYYIIFTIPALALGIPYAWETLIKNAKIRVGIMQLQLVATIIWFLYYFPVVLLR